MYENPTGDSPFTGGGGAAIISNTHVQDAKCDYYDTPYAKSGSPIKEASRRDDPLDEGNLKQLGTSASARYNVRQWMKNATTAAQRLQRAAYEEDFMDAVGAGVELTDSLSNLWRLRSSREAEFAEIVNILQIALAGAKFETLTEEQCAKIVALLGDCLGGGSADEDQVRLARNLLREAGFDPWRGFAIREDN